jgi:hypothetical protein
MDERFPGFATDTKRGQSLIPRAPRLVAAATVQAANYQDEPGASPARLSTRAPELARLSQTRDTSPNRSR